MITTITLERLKRKGYKPLLDVYYELNPSFLRTAVYENRTYGGGAYLIIGSSFTIVGSHILFHRNELLDF